MKVKVLRPFIDLSAGFERKVGDVFECSEARFHEIDTKLENFVEKVSEPAAAKEPAKKATKTTKKSGK